MALVIKLGLAKKEMKSEPFDEFLAAAVKGRL